jgi:hypothetical protein
VTLGGATARRASNDPSHTYSRLFDTRAYQFVSSRRPVHGHERDKPKLDESDNDIEAIRYSEESVQPQLPEVICLSNRDGVQ